MNTYYYAINQDGDYLFDNFPNNLEHLVSSFRENPKPFAVNIDGEERLARMGKKTNSFGSIYTLTTESKYINRLKLFRELVEISILSVGPLSKFHKDIKENTV